MKINGFSHVNVRTAQLDRMVEWYGEILDMSPGPRPDFTFRGAWLYVGENPYIHLVETPSDLQTKEPRIEHFAFDAAGMGEFAERLDAHGVTFTIDRVPGFPIVQINCFDPDGNHIHIDFSTDDAQSAGLI